MSAPTDLEPVNYKISALVSPAQDFKNECERTQDLLSLGTLALIFLRIESCDTDNDLMKDIFCELFFRVSMLTPS